MAAIDKIYGTTTQYDELRAWVIQRRPHLAKQFYQRDGYTGRRPICSFDRKWDEWLAHQCPFDWVLAQLKVMYPRWPIDEWRENKCQRMTT